MVSRMFVARDNKNRRANTVATFLGHCLLAIVFIAAGGCSAGGGGESESSPPAAQNQSAPAVASISLTPPGASLQVGQPQQFTATALDAGGNTIPGVVFTWSSNVPLVASVNSNGLVTGLASGGTLITASGGGRTSAPATVTVTVAPATVDSITLVPLGASLQVGQTQQFTATAKDVGGNTIAGVPFTWQSSNSAVASISGSGLARGESAGLATITASGGGATSSPGAQLTVTVAPPVVNSITLTPSGASLQVGQTQQFTATAKDVGGNTIAGVPFTWQSSNSAVASISGSGLARGESAGLATITASGGGATSSPGAQLTVTGVAGGGNSYSTNFSGTENPISEGGGRWLNGLVDGRDWLDIRTEAGVAYGTRTSQPGDAIDPTAILTGTWGRNQMAQVTLVVTTGGAFKEAEIRLNSSLSEHVCTGYEILYEITGTIAIVRWNGPVADYTFIAAADNIPGRAGNGGLVTGDVLKATNVNGVISAYLNDVFLVSATDTTYQAGAPGFGLNTYNDTDPRTYGVSSFSASSN